MIMEVVPAPAPAESEEAAATSRRPMNAFLLFCKRHRAIVKEKFPNLENRNITKILGEWWQSLGDAEKSSFNALANEYKEHVKREQPNFRWRKPPPSVSSSSSSAAAGGGNPQVRSAVREELRNGDVQQRQQQHQNEPHAVARRSEKGSSAGASKAPATAEAAPSTKPLHDRHKPPSRNGSNSSSSSSSPEPGLPGGGGGTSSSSSSSSAAPKPFKKRFLKMLDEDKGPASSDVREPVSPDAEHACKALLELAGVRQSSPTTVAKDGESSSAAAAATKNNGSESNSRSGTSSPSNCNGVGEGFYSLRDAVWSKVAKTLLKQEEEKGNSSGEQVADAPLNLSNQCSIRSQTIIEHIIENILDEPLEGQSQAVNGDAVGEQKLSSTLGRLNNNLNGGQNGRSDGSRSSRLDETAEEIKQRIYQGLKEDILKRPPGTKDKRSALWELLPHYNITTVTITGDKLKEKPISPPTTKAPSPAPVQPAKPPTTTAAASVALPKTTDANPPVSLPTVPAPIEQIIGSAVAAKLGGSRTASSGPNSRPLSNCSAASSEDDCARDRPLNDDTTGLNIKNLLAQSPAPPSPRSKNSTTPTSSLTTALIASVLEKRQQPVELLFADHKRPPLPPVSVTLVKPSTTSGEAEKPVNLTTTSASLPSVSLTPVSSGGPVSYSAHKRKLEEDDEDIRRSARACKGKRYQEFRDEGRLGQRKNSGRRSHKSGGTGADSGGSDHGSDVAMVPLQQTKLVSDDRSPAPTPPASVGAAKGSVAAAAPSSSSSSDPHASFDVTARLNAIPALSLESYQQKILKAKSSAPPTTTASTTVQPVGVESKRAAAGSAAVATL